VAYGMVLAFNFSVARGHCAPDDAARLKDHIGASHLPQKMSAIGTGKFAADALVEAMSQDKKVQNGQMRFILANGLGDTFIADNVSETELRDFLVAEGADAA
ncbi:MAG: 3-dehydroquinate synthase, partial [Parvibaculales bacterium]